MASDINLHVHPHATFASLHKGDAMWFLTYTGQPGFNREMQPITDNEIADALRDGFSDDQAIAYIETRLEAAGYEVQRLPPGTHDAAWALTFIRRY
jgi:hypothetical protein